MIYLLGFLIPILSFFLQSYPRFFNKFFGVDVWTRFLEIDLVRRNKHRIPSAIEEGFIIKGHFDYPPLFPWLLSFVPKKILEQLQGFVSPFFDALHCLAIFFIAYQITNNVWIAMLAQFIYMSIPIIALENSYLTARSFGYLSLTLALYPLVLYASSPQTIYLIVAYVFATIIFLTHRFATQSFLFAVIFFSIFDRTFFYLAVFLAGFLTAVLLTKGYYLKVLRGHWFNIYFWILNRPYRWAHQITGKSNAEGKRDIVGKIYALLGKLSPLTLIGLNVWLLSGFLFFYLVLINGHFPELQNPLYEKFALWILFFYFFGILILSVKYLMPIGEGQRYLEMATAPSAVLSSILFFTLLHSVYGVLTLAVLVTLFLCNFGVIFIVQTKIVMTDQTRSKTADMDVLIEYINKLKTKPRIVCIPHQLTTMTLYNSQAQVLVNADNKGLIYGDVMDVYPVLTKSMKELTKKFNLDYLLLRESYASIEELHLQKKNIIFRSGDMLLVKLK